MLQRTASRPLSIFLPVLRSRLHPVSATKLAALASRRSRPRQASVASFVADTDRICRDSVGRKMLP
jgi:hypothetical protein